MIEQSYGGPKITKDGVTVAKVRGAPAGGGGRVGWGLGDQGGAGQAVS
jgi:hypothetical protein